jgi:hypothetical protein
MNQLALPAKQFHKLVNAGAKMPPIVGWWKDNGEIVKRALINRTLIVRTVAITPPFLDF